MANKPFEKITIAEIVKQAKTTIGSFYARFPDKQALLAALFDQLVTELSDGLDESLAKTQALTPELRVESIVGIIDDGFRLRPAVMRSGQLLVWNKSTGAESPRVSVSKHGELLGKLQVAMEKVASDLNCSTPNKSAQFAIEIVLAASRHQHLFTDEITKLRISDDAFQKEMSTMVLNYLKYGV